MLRTTRILAASLFTTSVFSFTLSGCAITEQNRVVEQKTVSSFQTPYQGEKHSLVVGKFANNSNYMRGLFSDGVDRLGDQAKTVLLTHLTQTNRFHLMDRANMETLATESGYLGQKQEIEGGRYAIVGGVTEFGRRASGDKQLFGVLGSGKTQLAYAKVMLNVVDVRTSKIIYSSQGAGEYTLTSRQVAGFGSSSGYDATLNGKVLDLAIREAVNNLVAGLERGEWSIAK